MKDFAGKIAVVTGGGAGMGRELARQLAAQGCNIALCDVSADAMAETKRLCESDPRSPKTIRITTHVADVSNETQVRGFRDAVAAQHGTESINLLFNNAGIGGGYSLFTDSREAWERTFNICWGGVYFSTRAFLPMLVKSTEGHLVNTSSASGFWAMTRLTAANTAYSAAKFAVKGFTEALIIDLRLNAPHVKCSVVMPGYIGTSIYSNTRKLQTGRQPDDLTADEIAAAREQLTASGIDHSKISDRDIQRQAIETAQSFTDMAPMTAAQAATIILDGVKAERWRILVGRDAEILDQRVRRDPESAYEESFFKSFSEESGWQIGPPVKNTAKSN